MPKTNKKSDLRHFISLSGSTCFMRDVLWPTHRHCSGGCSWFLAAQKWLFSRLQLRSISRRSRASFHSGRSVIRVDDCIIDDHRGAIDFAEATKLCVDFKAARKRRVRRSMATSVRNRNGDRLLNIDRATATIGFTANSFY